MVSVRTGILRETHTYAQVGSTGDRTGDTHIRTGREYRRQNRREVIRSRPGEILLLYLLGKLTLKQSSTSHGWFIGYFAFIKITNISIKTIYLQVQ